MRITGTTFNYWAQRTAPKSLLPPKMHLVTIDQVVNSNGGVRPISTDIHNTLTILYIKRKHGEHVDWILQVARRPDNSSRTAFCRRLAKKLKGRT